MSTTSDKYYKAFLQLKNSTTPLTPDQWTRYNRIGKQIATYAVLRGYAERTQNGLRLVKMPTMKEVERMRLDACNRASMPVRKPRRQSPFPMTVPRDEPALTIPTHVKYGIIRRFINWLW